MYFLSKRDNEYNIMHKSRTVFYFKLNLLLEINF